MEFVLNPLLIVKANFFGDWTADSYFYFLKLKLIFLFVSDSPS